MIPKYLDNELTFALLPVGVPQTGTSVHGWQASPTGDEWRVRNTRQKQC